MDVVANSYTCKCYKGAGNVVAVPVNIGRCQGSAGPPASRGFLRKYSYNVNSAHSHCSGTVSTSSVEERKLFSNIRIENKLFFSTRLLDSTELVNPYRTDGQKLTPKLTEVRGGVYSSV